MKKDSIYVKNQPLSEAKRVWKEALDRSGFYDNRPSEVINVDEARGRIAATPVYAQHSSPTYNASAMDGIAVNFSNIASACEAQPVHLSRDHFLPVNTGNAVPEEFNAVVMIEDVHYFDDGSVELIHPATPWQHIRTVGEDIVATELIIPENHCIRPIDQGAMLASGVTQVEVLIPPRIVVIPTGSELIEPGKTVRPGQIIEFNTRILTGYLNQWGADAHAHKAVLDEPEELRQAILAAVVEYDIVITNAGASAGTKDFSNKVLESIGNVVVHGIATKPGKPVLLALIGDTPIVGLPGYPVSAVLTMRLFARELISGFLGIEPPNEARIEAVMSRPMHSSMGVDQFVRVTLGRVGDKLIATPSGKGAGSVMSMVRADGLLTIPARAEGVGAGELVSIELLRSKAEVDSTLVTIGSHDNVLDLLANFLHRLRPPIRLSSAHVGSMGGIMAIKRKEAHIAGSHLLDENTAEYNVSFIQRFLTEMPLNLINLCYREQGFMVQPGNPLKITGFHDIAQHGYSFINRQKGAGTRLLTDKILRENSIDPDQIHGYHHEEYTHMNIAATVASGTVDAGMGIRAAALALELDFVPIAEERYDLIVPQDYLADSRVTAALDIILSNKDFRQKVLSLGGYNLRDSGSVLYSQ